MLRKPSAVATSLFFVAVMVVALFATPAFASSGASGLGANAAQAGWQTLAPRATVLYTFKYSGGDTVQLEMMTNPTDGAGFNVWNQDKWTSRSLDSTTKPTGAGTKRLVRDNAGNRVPANDNLVWNSNTPDNQTYYVEVISNSDQPVAFNLQLTGNSAGNLTLLSGKAQPAAQSAAATPAARAAAPAGAAPRTLPVTGASDLLPVWGLGLLFIAGAFVYGGLRMRRNNG